MYAGEILLRAAALCAAAGRAMGGAVPEVCVVRAQAGSADVELSERLPGGLLAPRGLTFTDADSREIVQVESTDGKLVGQTRGAAWFPGGDKYGIQDGYLRGFMEAAAACIGDTSPLPTFGAVLAGTGQAGRGLTLRVIVREQVAAKTGQAKINPKTNQPYTEMMWYPVSQTLEDITSKRAALDADPAHAIRVPQAFQAQTIAPPAAVATPVAQPAPAAAPAPTAGAGAGLLAALQGKK